LPAIQEMKPDVALVEVQGADGLTALSQIHAVDPHCHVILMTRHASVDGAVAAIRDGALDYLAKPFAVELLRETLVTVRKRVERRETLLRLDADVAKQFEFYGMVGRGPVMQELFDTIRRVAPHLRTVLITGETGTGKELVAKALHRLGPRRDRRLIPLTCSAVVETLFERALWTHARRVHRRHGDEGGPVRARRRRHRVSRRDRRTPPVPAGEAVAHGRVRRSAAGRRARQSPRRRMRDCRD
jgi:DNA-binding NtrC family response regulator